MILLITKEKREHPELKVLLSKDRKVQQPQHKVLKVQKVHPVSTVLITKVKKERPVLKVLL